ncbi:PRC-barrel domain-containing protein [Enhydrobacter aerosaccus]|uniref:PRC-barrel domain-containing protein n=1 Tax=Enhydrobacter aerosaccus TaxID=225324 RepID=A0A1T4T5G8_9HYPH|nr:PRC-barrel domain-containing protein [Enhydrobacter aerosaccus]SKA35653.1 PRC-barrel domain-containing protein [Enhydrobacter aerosaccus]
MRLIPSVVAAAIGILASVPGYAQSEPPIQQLSKIDVVSVDKGERVSKIIGEAVVNEAHQTVGKVDDVILSEDGKSDVVVLSVGNFVGSGPKLVAFPYRALTTYEGELLLAGASKKTLTTLPAFKYAAK